MYLHSTVEPGDSKLVDSKLQALVNLLLLTKISNHSINHIIDSKHLAIVNIFVPLKELTNDRFDSDMAFFEGVRHKIKEPPFPCPLRSK